MKFEIKNRWSGELIFSIETDSWKLAVEAAIKAKADLSEANLSEADLSVIRNDFWSVLLFATHEVAALRAALIDGKVDGSAYKGECACLVGTIANAKKCDVKELPNLIKPNADRPAERFFMGIKKGDTPETNPVSKLALEWIDIWLENTKGTVVSK